MAIISTYCKKGGVGKTTLLGYLAHYYAQQDKKVLIISADDQNSIFKIFGSEHFVTDNDGVEVEPKKLRIKVIVPQYGGKVDTMELYATNPKVIDAITNYWENSKTYTAKGRLNFTTTTEQVIQEYDFGDDDISLRTKTVSELIVTKGTQAPMEDDAAFDPAELAAALKEHKAYIESLKDKATMKSAPAPAGTTSKQQFDLGF